MPKRRPAQDDLGHDDDARGPGSTYISGACVPLCALSPMATTGSACGGREGPTSTRTVRTHNLGMQ
eukprot:1284450-Alexandrium_andersonii.AAC.1